MLLSSRDFPHLVKAFDQEPHLSRQGHPAQFFIEPVEKRVILRFYDVLSVQVLRNDLGKGRLSHPKGSFDSNEHSFRLWKHANPGGCCCRPARRWLRLRRPLANFPNLWPNTGRGE